MSILSKIKYWYIGGPLPTRVANKDGSTTCRSPDTYEPTASARLAQYICKNLLIILGLLAAIIVPLFIYFDGKHSNNEAQKTGKVSGTLVVHSSNLSFKWDAL